MSRVKGKMTWFSKSLSRSWYSLVYINKMYTNCVCNIFLRVQCTLSERRKGKEVSEGRDTAVNVSFRSDLIVAELFFSPFVSCSEWQFFFSHVFFICYPVSLSRAALFFMDCCIPAKAGRKHRKGNCKIKGKNQMKRQSRQELVLLHRRVCLCFPLIN